MSKVELRLTLMRLELLLGVTERTFRRWSEGEEVPGPAEQALRAWIRLHDRNLPWRPDEESIVRDDQDQIARHRAHVIRLDEILARVEARGGPRVPWSVDRGASPVSQRSLSLTLANLVSARESLFCRVNGYGGEFCHCLGLAATVKKLTRPIFFASNDR
jgi:hypothetical protein